MARRWSGVMPTVGGSQVYVSGGSGIPEAPQDNNYYVRQNGAWVNLADAIDAINGRVIDGGDIETGISAGDSSIIDGGVVT